MYKFYILPSTNEQFYVRFNYNSEPMVWSETLTTKASAQNNIESIKANAPCADIVDLTAGETGSGYRWEIDCSKDGQYFTRFVASNGETMVHSETYTQKHNAKNCAASVSANAKDAEIIDETSSKAA